jgi:penicillin-binding protein 1A
VTIREAIKKSINIVAIKLANTINPDPSTGPLQNTFGTSIDYLRNKFHLSTIVTSGSHTDLGLSPLALGALTQGVYPYEMAAAYGVFGDGGIYKTPILYTKVTDNMGNPVLENVSKQSQSISAQAAYIMIDLMKGVVTGGTGTQAKKYLGSMPAAGKTGTAADKTNLWFCGLTPYYSGAVWIGHDKPTVPINGLSSSTAAGIWGKIMKVANKDKVVKDFSRPPGIVTEQICIDSGKSPNEYCYKDPRGSRVRSEIFVEGTQPIEICDYHKPPQIIQKPVTTDSAIGKPQNTTAPVDKSNNNKTTVPDTNNNTGLNPETGTINDTTTDTNNGTDNGTGINTDNETKPLPPSQ